MNFCKVDTHLIILWRPPSWPWSSLEVWDRSWVPLLELHSWPISILSFSDSGYSRHRTAGHFLTKYMSIEESLILRSLFTDWLWFSLCFSDFRDIWFWIRMNVTGDMALLGHWVNKLLSYWVIKQKDTLALRCSDSIFGERHVWSTHCKRLAVGALLCSPRNCHGDHLQDFWCLELRQGEMAMLATLSLYASWCLSCSFSWAALLTFLFAILLGISLKSSFWGGERPQHIRFDHHHTRFWNDPHG